MPGYSTVEHVIQTAFYADAFGVKPTCALYYIGWNDIRNAHINDLDPGYARFHLRTMVDGLQVRRYGAAYRSISPLFTVVVRLVSREMETIRPPELPARRQSGDDPVLEMLYRRNAQLDLDDQPWPRHPYGMDRADSQCRRPERRQDLRLAAFGARQGRLAAAQRFNAGLRDEAKSLGDSYVDVSPADFTADDFVDQGHFSEAGAIKFAHLIAPQVAEACRR